MGLMNFSGKGENLFCFRKSYKFCSNISNTRHVWFLCWKHSNARTKLNSSAFSWLNRDNIDTSIWPCRAYDGWFFNILMATMSLVPRFQHLTTWPNVPRPKNSSTCNQKINWFDFTWFKSMEILAYKIMRFRYISYSFYLFVLV